MRELTFFDMARSSDVKRWHIINTVRPQTVAEHSFMVALIALELTKKLTVTGSFFDSPREQFQFLCAALFHDMPETVYGDLPTPGKAVMREFTENPYMFDELDMRIMPNVPYAEGLLSPSLGWIIRVADLMEAYHFLCNNAAGPYAKQVRDALYGRLIKFTAEASSAMPNLKWPSAVIETLKDLGLTKPPAVYGDAEKDERI
jgi:5'-deoxynucleotidase